MPVEIQRFSTRLYTLLFSFLERGFESVAALIIAELEKYATEVWMGLKTMILKEINDPNSGILNYFKKSIDEIVDKLKSDKEMQDKLNDWARHNAYRLILKNTQNVSTLISNTIGQWEGRALSEKLELEVGKDLQFIRINGTIVGGLVGLAIYAITLFISNF